MIAEQWTTDWVIKKLTGHDKILSVRKDNENNLVLIERNFGENLKIITLSLDIIDFETVSTIIKSNNMNLILNIKKNYIVRENAYQAAKQNRVIIGGMGDAMRILNQEQNWPYQDPESFFIARGLEQHSKVRLIEKIDNKRFRLSTLTNQDIIIIYLNDYDLGIESVRKSIQEYKQFDCILKSNPNGRTSSDAINLAKSLNIKLLTWGELLRELNFKWE